MKKLVITLMLAVTLFAATYTLGLGAQGPTRGTVSFPTATTLTYTHNGVEIGPSMVLDSFQINATDPAGNKSVDTWIFVRITPVDNKAPIITSDTLVCAEGGSITWGPTVQDADTN